MKYLIQLLNCSMEPGAHDYIFCRIFQLNLWSRYLEAVKEDNDDDDNDVDKKKDVDVDSDDDDG